MLLIRQRSQLEDRYQLQPTALPEHPWPFTRQALKDYLQGLGLEPGYYDLRPIGPWHPMALESGLSLASDAGILIRWRAYARRLRGL